MSDADQTAVRFVGETDWGILEPGSPTLQELRFTGESFHQETRTVESNEIRDDRQIEDLIRTNVNASGDLNFELSYGTYDEFFKAALLSAAWTSPVTDISADSSIASDATNNRYEGADGDFTNYAAGAWVKVSGWTDTGTAAATNNGYQKIASIESSNPGTSDDDWMVIAGRTLVTKASGTDPITITQGGYIANGTTTYSFSMEREYKDLTNEFAQYRGMTITGFNLTFTPEGIITGSFSFVGKDEATASATFGDGSPTAANTNEVMNAVDHVTDVWENDTAIDLTGLTLTLANNERERLELGYLGPTSLGFGKCRVTGTFTGYYESSTLVDKALNMTESSVSVAVEDSAGNGYVIDVPADKYTSGQRVAGGTGQDVIADMAFTAIRENTEDITIRMTRFAA